MWAPSAATRAPSSAMRAPWTAMRALIISRHEGTHHQLPWGHTLWAAMRALIICHESTQLPWGHTSAMRAPTIIHHEGTHQHQKSNWPCADSSQYISMFTKCSVSMVIITWVIIVFENYTKWLDCLFEHSHALLLSLFKSGVLGSKSELIIVIRVNNTLSSS